MLVADDSITASESEMNEVGEPEVADGVDDDEPAVLEKISENGEDDEDDDGGDAADDVDDEEEVGQE